MLDFNDSLNSFLDSFFTFLNELLNGVFTFLADFFASLNVVIQ